MTALRWPWLVFSVALAAAAAALLALGLTAVQLERDEASARLKLAHDERARRALWRLDLALARLITLEAARAPESFDAAGGRSDRRVLLRYQVLFDGRVTSSAAEPALESLRPFIVAGPTAPEVQLALADYSDFEARNRFAQENLGNAGLPEGSRISGMTARWYGPHLVLERRIEGLGAVVRQGTLLDWQTIQRELLAEARRLVPSAELVPATASATPSSWRLASLPVELQLGPTQADDAGETSGARVVVLAAVLALAVALAALGALLAGSISLAQRRAAFVSAVTHELRTPLTTFQLYSELLEQQMVPDDRRAEYLATLRRESQRLAALVENVLAWSKLEGRRRGPPSALPLAPLLEQRILPRLRERAAQAGMAVECAAVPAVDVLAEPMSVEQVLFNLVDNAVKYARRGRIWLDISVKADAVTIEVRDEGPGLTPEATRRLFEPFQKSAAVAAESAPGVGLGLALSRRLARELGGDLTATTRAGGASFTLRLRTR